MSDKFTCGYRRVQGMDRDDSPMRMSGSGRDEYRADGSCTYCGSLSQEAFFKAIEDGEELGPTDKDYKVYVGGTGKFYFCHLDRAGYDRFVELHNDKKMKIGYPGHFYILPFFCRGEPK